MFDRTYYATHPDMMECVSNEELRDRYLIQGLFRAGECVLNYTHADRFVIGGVEDGLRHRLNIGAVRIVPRSAGSQKSDAARCLARCLMLHCSNTIATF